MNVLIACEESQTVCAAFRQLGFNAYSCDIVECSGEHPEWHLNGEYLLNTKWRNVMIDFLEKHYIFFTRFVWIATYIVLLGVLDFYNVYKINDVPTFICFIFGIYWLAKILTAMIVIGVAALLQINVDIELKSSFTINNKYIF